MRYTFPGYIFPDSISRSVYKLFEGIWKALVNMKDRMRHFVKDIDQSKFVGVLLLSALRTEIPHVSMAAIKAVTFHLYKNKKLLHCQSLARFSGVL